MTWPYQAQDAFHLLAVTPSIIMKAAQATIVPAAMHPKSWSAAHLPITGNKGTIDTIFTPNGM